jgi:6-phosphogluconate dehydrogenase
MRTRKQWGTPEDSTAVQLGMIGLGRMGGNMVRRLLQTGHTCVVFDLNQDSVQQLASEGAIGTASLQEFVAKLPKPRVAWLMVPDEETQRTVDTLASLLEEDDLLIDGGNSHFKDDIARAKQLQPKGIHYVDVGTSGGIWGLERGYCLMVGGPPEAFKRLEPALKSLAPGRGTIERTPGREKVGGTAEEGYLHCGPAGAGHFVKMVHNGIEYGIMQAYAEGFDIFKHAERGSRKYSYKLNLSDIAEVWRRGSVVGSWLLDLTAMALLENPELSKYSGFVQDTGEGRWTVLTAIEQAVPAEVLTSALYTRFRSRMEHTFAEKVLSAMRHKFGGHLERPTGG